MRRCKRSGMLALSVSDLDAVEEVGVSLASLFRNEHWAWGRVSDAIDRRRVNRESVGLSHDRTGRTPSVSERAAETARAQLLTSANRPVFDSIAFDDAQRASRLRAELALIAALPDSSPIDLKGT